MEIKGTIFTILPQVTGNGKNGDWVKQSAVIEMPGKFPKKVCVTFWGNDMVDRLMGFTEGEEVVVAINLESREYNNNWYTEAKAWKISTPGASPSPLVDTTTDAEDPNDLPF